MSLAVIEWGHGEEQVEVFDVSGMKPQSVVVSRKSFRRIISTMDGCIVTFGDYRAAPRKLQKYDEHMHQVLWQVGFPHTDLFRTQLIELGNGNLLVYMENNERMSLLLFDGYTGGLVRAIPETFHHPTIYQMGKQHFVVKNQEGSYDVLLFFCNDGTFCGHFVLDIKIYGIVCSDMYVECSSFVGVTMYKFDASNPSNLCRVWDNDGVRGVLFSPTGDFMLALHPWCSLSLVRACDGKHVILLNTLQDRIPYLTFSTHGSRCFLFEIGYEHEVVHMPWSKPCLSLAICIQKTDSEVFYDIFSRMKRLFI